MTVYKPYLDGSAFTPENGYHGSGQGIGEKLFTVGHLWRTGIGNNQR